jgi:SAM-dependent methyltransferase
VSQMSDRQYLLTAQYNDSSKLDARISLHQRFSTNEYGWVRWVFDRLDFPSGAHIVELGCGKADLWLENIHCRPDDWSVVLSDLSWGMLMDAQGTLGINCTPFRFVAADIQALPFEDRSFDGAIANHMLYHVPDLARALCEVRRILRPGGLLYAATNGREHLRELRKLVGAFEPHMAFGPEDYSFSLENGAAQLAEWFGDVRLHRYEDSLAVREGDPLIAYIVSSVGDAEAVLVGERLEELKSYVEAALSSQGVLRITKDVGLFVARRY